MPMLEEVARMPLEDLFSTKTNQYKLREEKAIVSAVIQYFEATPFGLNSTRKDTDSLIINAFHRYFTTKSS
jgi:hypothetical protein